jgi:hypothetical protein
MFLCMIPLAVSGPVVIGVVVAAALQLTLLLLRAEMREDAEDEVDRQAVATQHPPRLSGQ